MSYNARTGQRIMEQEQSLTREGYARMQGDTAAVAAERLLQHQLKMEAEAERRRIDSEIPAAWVLAGALMAGDAIKRAVQGPVEPVEPTQVVQARVIREEPQRALKAPPTPLSARDKLYLVLTLLLLVLGYLLTAAG